MSESTELPYETDVATVAAMQQAGEDFLLLDVREDEEYATASIAGSVLIPMSQLGERVAELEQHRNRLIVVHCHHGVRSMQVTQALRNHGFHQAQSMAGGIDQWSEQIDPTVPKY